MRWTEAPHGAITNGNHMGGARSTPPFCRQSMSDEDLRRAFQAFAGRSVFLRFVLQLRDDANRDFPGRGRAPNRLRFWQTELWDSFCSHIAIESPDLISIRRVLLWCPIHQRDLVRCNAVQTDRKRHRYPGTPLPTDFKSHMDKSFPFGFGGFLLNCPTCVSACDLWFTNAEIKHSIKPVL